MPEKFRHEDGPDAATRLLFPRGEFDSAMAGDVRDRIEQALAAGKRRVILDLSETTSMATSALTTLLDANARMTRFGARLLIVVPGDSRVRRLFSVTRLDKVLKVLDSRDAALAL